MRAINKEIESRLMKKGAFWTRGVLLVVRVNDPAGFVYERRGPVNSPLVNSGLLVCLFIEYMQIMAGCI